MKKMTSEERREVRYQRRIRERYIKRVIRSLENSNFDKVFGFDALIEAFKKCSKTNRWKTSVKLFGSKVTVNCAEIARKLRTNTYKSKPFRDFVIVERGHIRNVQSLNISDMTVQGSFRDNCLHPIIRPYLIYDNGACLSNKGTSFALKRFVRHLKYHIDKYGNEGYIYFFYFKSYFRNINRNSLNELINKVLIDRMMYERYCDFISKYSDGGLSLGSSVSQICAIFYPNKVDHYVKDELGIKCYGRYMDDGYIICKSLSELKSLISLFEQKCKENHIILNKDKCKIIKVKNHYTFLKTRFHVTDSGRIVRRVNKKSNVIERRKIKKFKELVSNKRIRFQYAILYFHSWLCSRRYNTCFHSNLNMIRYFNHVFNDFGRYRPPSVKNRKTKVLFYLSKIA